VIELEREDDGSVLVLLDRPPVNALSLELVQALTAAIAGAVAERARAIVLSGRGPAFSAGIDTKAAPTYSEAQRREAIAAINAMVSAIYAAPVPVVAGINGHALGGGLVMALACDARVASSGEYWLALNEVEAGVPFPAGPLTVVHAELDAPVVRDLCLSGRRIRPDEALELRVVDEIAQPAELLRRAAALAGQLAANGAYAIVKAQLRARVSERLAQIADADDDPLLRALDAREA
jgi:enoyl-CoA hydratase